MNIQKPKHITSLASSAILVSIHVSMWSATINNKELAAEIANGKNATRKSLKAIENILADHPLHRAMGAARASIYNVIGQYALPWGGGYYLLPMMRYQKFMQDFKAAVQKYDESIDALVAEYPTIVSNMAFERGTLFKREDYPDPALIKPQCKVTLHQTEVPVGDFRVTIADDLADDLHKHYTQQTESLIDELVSEQSRGLMRLLESVSAGCTDEVIDAGGKKKVSRGRIYETTLTKLREQVDLLAEFNPTGNALLEEARGRLAIALAGVTVESLRESDSTRDRVKREVDDILNKFKF